MPRRPLWKAPSVLLAAWLAVPAAAMDAAVPVDPGPAPVTGSDGAAGASIVGSGGVVAAVPTLSAGLNSPVGAPLAAAPAAAPVALTAGPLNAAPAAAAPAARPAEAPAAPQPASVPGFVRQDAAAKAELPAAAAPDVRAAGGGPASAASSAHPTDAGDRAAQELDKHLFLLNAGSFGITDFFNFWKSGHAFDGSRAREGDSADRDRVDRGRSAPALNRAFQLHAASEIAAPEPPGPEVVRGLRALPAFAAPGPPHTEFSDFVAAKIVDTAAVLWAKIKGSAVKAPRAEAAPVVTEMRVPIVRDASDPLETPDGLLVHAPRALRFDALGYRVHFAPPDGAPSTPVADEPVRVRVERGAGDAGTEVLRRRIASFNGLIEANFTALPLIAQSSSKMNVKTANLVLEKVEEMAAYYAQMVGPERGLRMTGAVADVAVAFGEAVKGLSDGDLLPPKAVALVMPLDRKSMHYYINVLHEEAVREVNRTDANSPANLRVRLGQGPDERALALVDLSEHPLVRGGRLTSPAFKALIEAMRRSKDQPKGSLILQDHQFWGHFKLGAHSAEVYANFSPPDEGGMLRVRYQEWGNDYANQTRLYYVARILQKTGFHVEQDDGYLTALIDKDHASQTVDEMTDTFALAVQALHATVGIDYALPMLVRDAKTSEEVARRIDQWVDLVLGEGTLPFYVKDEHAAMVEGWNRYRSAESARAQLREALNRTLSRLGLPAIPAEAQLGQRTIDRFVNEPIESALARGGLRLTSAGELEKTPGDDPLAETARAVAADERRAARMAEAVSSLDPGLFRFETVGSLGRLNLERAERRLEPDARVVVHALRDPRTGQIGFARAEISDLKPGGRPRPLDPAGLFSRLAEQGYPVAPFVPSAEPAGLEQFQSLLKSEPVAERSMGRRVQGLAASPGPGHPVLARVTYDPARAAQGGFIFVAPYTTPDDLGAIRGSKAVITTSGGLLSHAAITTREMGIPAVILPRAEWRDGAATLDSPDFGAARRIDGIAARPLVESRGAELSEGALVRLDPASGAVEVFPAEVGGAVLDAADALARYDEQGGASALDLWILSRLSGPGRSGEEKAALYQEALDGLAARAMARPGAAADLARFQAALARPDAPLAARRAEIAAALNETLGRDTWEFLNENREAAAQAISIEAVERALRRGEARAARWQDIANALGASEKIRLQVDLAISALRRKARVRSSVLLARDVAELEEHARLFPTATVEVLPRLKAAVAKAKRRGAELGLIFDWESQVRRLESSRAESMRGRAPAVLPLRQVLDMDVPRVGGKAAKLGEISEVVAHAGGEVPPGLALTVDAYRRFLEEAGLAEELERIAADAGLSPDERSARARKLILSAPLTADSGVGRSIVRALRGEGLDKTMLAVRSSAVDEDGAEAAFAGAGDTHLYVSPEELLPHVKDIWASLWNPRAMLYRQTKGLATENLAQAVVVQAMVPAEVSGVAFTQDPVSGDGSRLIVNAAFGLGEGVVSGRVAPDQYVVGKSIGREILPPMIADKKLAIVRGKGGLGVEEHKMPPEWRRRRAMTPAKLAKLNDVARALENHFGYALDIEFSFVGDKLFILQARPVTGAAAEEEPVPAAVPRARASPRTAAPPAAESEPRRVLFVCTGNTCRSPMAERLAKQKLRSEGRDGDFEVASRGLDVAAIAAPMTENAGAALRARGADSDGHAALPFAPSDAIWADVILTMTSAQAGELLSRYPDAKGKVFTLGQYSGVGGEIADPYGGGAARYRAAAAQIEAAVDSALDRAGREAAPAAGVR